MLRALAQITHRTMRLRATFSEAKLQQAFSAAYGGQLEGRHIGAPLTDDVWNSQQRLFDLGKPVNAERRHQPGFRRAVAVIEFGPQWQALAYRFDNIDRPALLEEIADRYRATRKENLELFRLVHETPDWKDSIAPGVASTDVW